MKLFSCVTFMLLLLHGNVVSSISSADKEIIQTGINSLSIFNSHIKANNFQKFVSTLTQNTKPTMYAVSGLLNVKQTNPSGNELNIFNTLKNSFNEENKVLQMPTSGFKDVKDLIDWTVVQIRYGTHEESIKACVKMLSDIWDAPNTVLDIVKKHFIMKYESDFRNSALKVWQGLIFEGSFTKNIMAAAKKYTNGNRYKVQQFGMGVVQLLAQAIEVEIAYAQMKYNSQSHTTYVIDSWQNKIQSVKDKLSSVDREIVDKISVEYGIYYATTLKHFITTGRYYYKSKLLKFTTGFVPKLYSCSMLIIDAVIGIVRLKQIRYTGADLTSFNQMKINFTAAVKDLGEVTSQFEDVRKQIDWTAVQVKYSFYQTKIKAAFLEVRRFLAAPCHAIAHQKNTFIAKYESDFKDTTYNLWESLVTGETYQTNLLLAAVKYTNNDKTKVQTFAMGVTQLLLEGVQADMVYTQFKYNNNVKTDSEKDVWMARIQDLRTRLYSYK